jgi:hypothetical protein
MYKGGRWASVVESEGTFKLVSALRLTDISAYPVTKWVFTDLETSRCEHIPEWRISHVNARTRHSFLVI